MPATESKPGVKTTEFWMMIAMQIILTLNTLEIWTYVPERYSLLAQTILGTAYMLSRGWAKSGVPAVVETETTTWDKDAVSETPETTSRTTVTTP